MGSFGGFGGFGKQPAKGPTKKGRAQAIAIALSEERKAGKVIPKTAKGSAISSAIRKHLGGPRR